MPFGTWPGKSDRKRRHRQKGIVITKLKLRQLHDGLSKINEWMLWHRQIDRAGRCLWHTSHRSSLGHWREDPLSASMRT